MDVYDEITKITLEKMLKHVDHSYYAFSELYHYDTNGSAVYSIQKRIMNDLKLLKAAIQKELEIND